MSVQLEVKMASDASAVTSDFAAASKGATQFGNATQDAAAVARKASLDMSGVGDSADDLAGKTGKATGALGALAGGLEAVGLGPYAAALQGAAIATDVASGASDALALITQSTMVVKIKDTAATVAHGVASAATAAATGVMTAAQWALNAALSANPVALIVIGVIALVAAVVLAYKKSETFREIVTAAFEAVKGAAEFAFNWVKSNWPLILAIITGPIGLAVLAVVKHWDDITAGARNVRDKIGEFFDTAKTWVGNAFDAMVTKAGEIGGFLTAPFKAVVDIVADIIDKVKSIKLPDVNPFSRASAPATAVPRGVTSLVNGRFTAAAAPGAVIHLTINGAIDPIATGRQVVDVIGEYLRSVGQTGVVVL